MNISITQRITRVQVATDSQTPTNILNDTADRRITLEPRSSPVCDTLRWEKRPNLPEGNDAKVYQIIGPEHRFFVIIGYVRNASQEVEAGFPFEVIIAGEGPRALNALAKSISMDMRSMDRGWLKQKLEAICKTEGVPFDMRMPDGATVRMESEVAAFARLVLFQCNQLGAFTEECLAKDMSVRDALMSKRRPRTTAEGGLAWYADIDNQATGDKLKVFLPELHMPNGQKRPYEVWFDGVYPLQSFRGLAKSLSLDLQVIDIGWAIRKLHQLRKVSEDQGGFWAQVPGSDKSAYYASTTAYIAELILHRLDVLGVAPQARQHNDSNVVAIAAAADSSADEPARPLGQADCPSCQTRDSVRFEGGCSCCNACGWSRC